LALTAIALNCTLKASTGEPSSTAKMIGLLSQALAKHQVSLSETIRIADHDVRWGVTSDEGCGDEWPKCPTR